MGTRQSPAFRPVPPLFAAFDIEVLWNKADRQATVHAEITENTLRAVTAILNPDQDGYDDTNPAASTDDPAPIGHLISTLEGTRAVTVARDPQLA